MWECSLLVCECLTGVYLCSLPTCCMGVQQNKYIRWLAQKNTFVFLPGECELFKMKAGEEK